MSPANDPFYAGTPTNWKMARWFAEIWQDAGYTSGVHLRRVHYWTVSQNRQMHNGEQYENTMKCWKYLTQASKMARYLGLIRIEDVRDNKSPEPNIAAWYSTYSDLWHEAKLPDLDEIKVSLYGPGVPNTQPYHLEVMAAKLLRDDVDASLRMILAEHLSIGRDGKADNDDC